MRILDPRRAAIEAMIRAGTHVAMTSSAGRLFDAVASLVGLGDRVTYEGQAAMQLECASVEVDEPYPLPLCDGAPLELDPRPLIIAIVSDLDRGCSVATIGGRFHAALAEGIARTCVRVREASGLATVAITGGCFQNRLLSRLVTRRLHAAGFDILANKRVPAGDGGIALGQAAIAAWRFGHVPRDPR